MRITTTSTTLKIDWKKHFVAFSNNISVQLKKRVDRLFTPLIREMSKRCTDFPLRIANEIDFLMYRCHYKELLTYFDIVLNPGIDDPTVTSLKMRRQEINI